MNHMVFLSQHLKWMCKQASTNTHTASLPQTLYNSALGSHRRQCRWNTPPSPAPSARCRRSENGTGRFVRFLQVFPDNSQDKKNTPWTSVFSRTHYACLTHLTERKLISIISLWLKGWNIFIILQTLDLLFSPLITWPLGGALCLLFQSVTKHTLQLLCHIFKADCAKSRCNPLSVHCSDYQSLV